MRLTLERCWNDWYSVLNFDTRRPPCWASVEGSKAEWLAVANALRNPGLHAVFRRVSCAWCPDRSLAGGWDLHSPRNAMGANDRVWVERDEGAAFADRIAEVLALPDDGEAA